MKTSRLFFGPLSSISHTDLLEDIGDNFFTHLFSRRAFQSAPALNIAEKDKAYKISLALPGIRKEDVKLAVEDDILSITHEQNEEEEEKDEDGYLHREFHRSSFKRNIRMPRDGVDVEAIKASYKDGILNSGSS